MEKYLSKTEFYEYIVLYDDQSLRLSSLVQQAHKWISQSCDKHSFATATQMLATAWMNFGYKKSRRLTIEMGQTLVNPQVIRVLIAHTTIPDGTVNDLKDFFRSCKV